MHLVGRAAELRRIEALLDGPPSHGGALVVRGEPGIGKSALLEEAVRSGRERGMRLLRTGGIQSEARLPFAGLHQLLWPVTEQLDALAPPQRHAVLAAFGMTERETPDLFLVALGALNVLSEVASDAPLLVVVEDAHWLDRASTDVLAFVARRLETEPVALLAATRGSAEGLPELVLEGLGEEEAARLVDSAAPAIAPEVRRRVLTEAAGNPLALVELPVAAARLDSGALLPAWLPLTARLEHAFAAHASGLPAATRRVLLTAALNDGSSLSETLTAAKNVTGDALAPALAARLVTVEGDELRFRHPLVRSALRQSASLPERHAAHAALAAVLGARPERRVWHRAASVVGSDEAVAAELDEAAASARRRGAHAVALSALVRAAELTPDEQRRGARLLRAAELASELGRPDVVVRMLRAAEPLPLGRTERTRISWLRELHDSERWTGRERTPALVELVDTMREDGDPERALKWLRNLAFRIFWSYPDEEATDGLVLAAIERMPFPRDRPELVEARATVDPVGAGRETVVLLARPRERDPAATFHLVHAATSVGAYDRAAVLIGEAVTGLRTQGQLGLLAQMLVSQAWAAFHLGSWDAGLAAAAEADRLARETGQQRWAVAGALAGATLRSLRGEPVDADIDAAEAELLPMGASPLLVLVQIARGVAALGEGRHGDAYDSLHRAFDPSDIAHHRFIRWWAFVDLVDSAVHSGRHEEARALLAGIEAEAERSGSPLLSMAVHYARPVLAPDEAAEPLFEQGIANADVATWPLTRARLLLAYGAWLRRRRRLADSRAPLRAAREAFDALGAVRWGERARQELRASGETSRRRTPEAWDELTPQELQIAQMAAAGLTNREIGERLYLSHRTIGSHLYRIFPKLGISSRAELRDAVG